MKIAKTLAAVILVTTISTATSMEIEPGMWGIDEELNGKPGRGLQIDQQGGDLMIVTYFGYRPDGSALFLQSSGAQSGTFFEGDLAEYSGGTVLAGPRSTGEFLSNPGRIRVNFSSATTGTIILPGESEKKISRLAFENHTDRFVSKYFKGVIFNGRSADPQPYNFRFTLTDGQFNLVAKHASIESFCEYKGTFQIAGKGITASGKAACSNGDSTDIFDFKTGILTVSREGIYSGEIYAYSTINPIGWHLSGNHMGICTNGVVIGQTMRC